MTAHRITVDVDVIPVDGSRITDAVIDRAIAVIDDRLVIADGVFKVRVAGFRTDIPAEVAS